MNYIKHLTGFFDRIIQDRELNPTHISLYIALFQAWNVNRFKNPISITRDEMMRISKICSKATYHKCMRELNEKQYIKYEPSFNPYKGSMVILFNFSEDLKPVQKKDNNTKKISLDTGQVLDKHKTITKTTTETATEQALVPSINYINNTNISNDKNVSNLEKHTKKFEEINNSNLKNETEEEKEKKLREKKKTVSDSPNQIEINHKTGVKENFQPLIEEVKTYFQENNFPELEAQKFFNYFSSIGWLVGGKTPMVDWQAAAQNWMINALKYISNAEQPNRAKQLNTTTDKDYSEPL
ncbi:hypothetical protein [Flavobacterium daejeonense]|uniref:hypothetical protein n=1 Tax=Flavobacterium daejeonense TaxID=350893 RepID=UPI00047E9BB6|nr:hypothetical protein [Flavobacterium daejeonense]